MNGEDEHIGKPIGDAPKRDPTAENCMGKKKMKREGEVVRDDDGNPLFDGYCRAWPGKRTDHVGEGRCAFHGGNNGGPTGTDNGNFKHGLFSDVIREEDKQTLQTIEDMTTAAKLESTLNMQVMKLHRAIEGMESDDRAAFMDVFEDLVAASAEPNDSVDKEQLRYLAKMLGQNDRAIREWMDLIRKTAKDLHKITDGETVTVEHGVDDEGLEELQDMANDLF